MKNLGYVEIPNAVIEQVCKEKLLKTSSRLLLWILKETKGGTRAATISEEELLSILKVSKRSLQNAIFKLINLNMVFYRNNSFSFNNDSSAWKR